MKSARQVDRYVDKCVDAMRREQGKCEHEWIEFRGLPCCKLCGVVKRRDGRNKPCRGRVGVATRTTGMKEGGR